MRLQPNPQHSQQLCQFISNSPYPGLLSLKLVEVMQDYARFETLIEHKHLQPYQVVHGGVLASLIDSATFWAVYYSVAEDDGLTSVDLKLNYLSPCRIGEMLITEGRTIKTGKKLSYAEATIKTSSGTILAHGTSTLMTLPGKGLVAEPPLPAKYLS